MNEQHKAIRALLTTMSPLRAEAYVKSFHLPEAEETCIILRDIQDKSIIQICGLTGLSEASVKRKRQDGFAHIADTINNPTA